MTALHDKFGFNVQAFLATPVSTSYDHGEVTHLYLMQSGQFHKVGIAANVQKRLTSIQAHSGHPVKVERTIPYESRLWALIAERTVHGMLAKWRIHGEWFDVDRRTAGQAMTIIKAEMPRLIHRHKQIAQQKRDAMRERYETDPAYRAEIDAERKRVNDNWERAKAEMLGSPPVHGEW